MGLALYLRQIRFVVQRILFLQKFCSLDNFLCTLTFSNQERLFFADVLFLFKINLCTFEREERIKMEEKVKYAFLGGIVVLLTKLIFNFSAEGFLMHRSRGNYDCEPLLRIYSGSNWAVLYI